MEKTVLAVSGLDPTGGAGLIADVSFMRGEKVHTLGIPTAITVQTGRKVIMVKGVPKVYLRESLAALRKTFRISGVKIGMLPSQGIARELYRFLRTEETEHVVLDPVFFSSYGYRLCPESVFAVLKKLIPLSSLVTPNGQELRQLAAIFGIKSHRKAALGRTLSLLADTPILLTGGQGKEKGTDQLFRGDQMETFPGKPVRGKNFHGSGCALSSLILVHLVKGHSLTESIRISKGKLESLFQSGFRSLDGRWFLGGR